jgi:hypothetical protein
MHGLDGCLRLRSTCGSAASRPRGCSSRGAFGMGMTLEEALVASTLTAAASLDRADRVVHPATNGGTA